MKKSNQQGFGFVVLLLAVVVVGVVGLGAVRIMGANKSNLDSSSALTPKAKVPVKIESSAQLKAADTALEQTPVDTGLNLDQLDNDLSALN